MVEKGASLEDVASHLAGPAGEERAVEPNTALGVHRVSLPQNHPTTSTLGEHRRQDVMENDHLDTAGINALVTAEDSLSLHGPNSSFRDLPSHHAALAASASIPDVHLTASERPAKLREWALQLFANAALERQREHAYLSSPTFELDGVDHHSAFTPLNYYWNHQNDAYLMVYRPAVMHSLATGDVYANKLLLNALYYAGALLSGHERFMDDASKPSTLGDRFFHRFQGLLTAHLEVSLIATISALVVMSSALLTRGKQTLAYLYLGLAQRMITDLGFHVNPDLVNHASYSPHLPTYSMQATDIEQQRRVLWGAYIHDQFQSLFFSRSPELRLIKGFEPPKEIIDTYDELEIWSPSIDDTCRAPGHAAYISQPKHSISTRASLLELAEITSDIIDKFYTPRTDLFSEETATTMFDMVQEKL